MGDAYKKPSTDAAATAIARVAKSLGAVSRNTTVADITSGEVVAVELNGAAPSAGTATIRARATGAILLGCSEVPGNPNDGMHWSIQGTTLTVTGPDAGTVTVYFWVF